MDPDSVGLPEVREPTQRDKVAAMTIDGWTPTEIAAYLNCGKRTVMFHLEQIAAHVPPGGAEHDDVVRIEGVPV